MKISPQWLREFVDVSANDSALADELTHTGTAVESIASENGHAIFEMEITTNRVDCMNHYGIARECSAIYDRELKPISPRLPAAKSAAKFPIEIEDSVGCARYTARVIRNLKIGPSPQNVIGRLHSVGAGSINNAVDASNYTLLEMGHPTHAFDLDLLAGGKIIIRRARAGETLKTLDGIERKLHPDDLIIADANKPVALAGVMGGFDSMITAKTKNILIESAWFDPVTVRRTARRLGMHTDASHRFERGADWGATPLACARVAELILQSAGGEITGEANDMIARQLRRGTLTLRRSEILRILGQEISEKDIQRILGRLGFSPKKISEGEWQVSPPTWRLDVEREIDVIEEIARLYGFNNFKNTLPAFSGSVRELPHAAKNAKLHATLRALGYNEAISTTFVSAADAAQFAPQYTAVELANPLNEETAVMRTSLVPGMLNMIAYNLNRGSENLRLFECGNVFDMSGECVDQHQQVCLAATGAAIDASVHMPARPVTFFDLKGSVEQLLELFSHDSLSYGEAPANYYQPGRSASALFDGEVVARFGQLVSEVAATKKIKPEVFIAEIFLEPLYKHNLRQPRYQALSRYPAVSRDFSFIFSQAISFAKIEAEIGVLQISELQSFQPADLLAGKSAHLAGVEAGKYSLLLRAQFQSPDRTLRDDEVAAWSQRIIAQLEKLGGKLRAS